MQPQEIFDNPVPLLTGSSTAGSGSNANYVSSGTDSETPNTEVDQRFPAVIVAHQTISESLDTQTRAIKGAYTFEQLGSIKIGSYDFGVSGEVDISPDGISAVNVNGEITFTLDGTTGDATFLGTLQAGTIVGGDGSVIIEESLAGNGRIVLYNNGIPAILIGDPDA